MSGDEYVVPSLLRRYHLVPRQSATGRPPARVSAGAFKARGMAVPEDPREWNVYRLTRKQGLPWSPSVDAWVARRGAELLPHGALTEVDIDMPVAADGIAPFDSLGWLAERAAEAGEKLDLSATLTARSPGHPENGHLPGWNSWFRADPDRPVRMGPLEQCRQIELKPRGTCPGSPGYRILYVPDQLPVLPRWIARLAGMPRVIDAQAPAAGNCPPGLAWRRMCGMTDALAKKESPGRNNLLFSAAALAGELGVEFAPAEAALLEACGSNRLLVEDGLAKCRGTIRSGYSAGTRVRAVAHA